MGRPPLIEVVLHPGDLLFLPAYWWHEVLTEPQAAGELTVSVNFWFMATAKLLSPSLPLPPPLRVELARQLEYFASDTLDDRARLVPRFLQVRPLASLLASARWPPFLPAPPIAHTAHLRTSGATRLTSGRGHAAPTWQPESVA